MSMKYYTIPYVEMVWRLDDRDWRLARDCMDKVFNRDIHRLLLEEILELGDSKNGIAVDILDIKVPTTRTVDGRSMCMREFIGYKHWGSSPSWFGKLKYVHTVYFYRDCGRGEVHLGDREGGYDRSVPLYYEEILNLLSGIGDGKVFDESVVIKFRGERVQPVSSEWARDVLILPYMDILKGIKKQIGEDADLRVVISGVGDVWNIEFPID